MVHCQRVGVACASPEYCTPSLCARVMSDVITPGNPAPAAPAPYSVWRHRNGNEYVVILLTNCGSVRADKYPPTVVYRNAHHGALYSRRLDDWHRSMTFVRMLKQDEIDQHRADL